MDADELWDVIKRREGLKLDFKREYHLGGQPSGEAKAQKRDELIKDILALANGNVTVAGETAYLIIGVGDDRREDGIRDLFDVGPLDPEEESQRMLQAVNNACRPRLPDLWSEIVELDGKRILVITIPPSPYLHETRRALKRPRPKHDYQENTVFIRCAEGIVRANDAEREAIKADKLRRPAFYRPSAASPHEPWPSLSHSLGEIASQIPGAVLPRLQTRGTDTLAEGQRVRVLLQERQRHLLEGHTPFAGRQNEIELIREFIQNQPSGYVFVSAPSGLGKTASLANLVSSEPEMYAWYFLDRQAGDHTRGRFLRSMVEQLLAYYKMPVRDESDLPQDSDRLEALYSKLLRLQDVRRGQPLVLVIDGVDEAEGHFINNAHIPRELPLGKFVIFSARQTGRDYVRELGLPKSDVLTVELAPLNPDGIAALLRVASGAAEKWADDPNLLAEVTRVSQGDPFYLRYLVEDIAAEEIDASAVGSLPSGLHNYLDGWWQEVRRAVRSDSELRTLMRDLMGFLMVAQGPIPSSDLLKLLPGLEWDIDEVLDCVGRFVLQTPVGQEVGYSLCHQRFQQYLSEQKLPGKVRAYQQRLLAYCAEQKDDPTSYVLRSYATHLAEAGEWDVLHALVATGTDSQPWAETRCVREGSYAGYRSDVGRLWQHSDDAYDTAEGIRCALITSSVSDIAGSTLSELVWETIELGGGWTGAEAMASALTAVLADKLWTPERALSYVRLSPYSDQKADGLVGLAPHLSESLLAEALEIAHSIDDLDARERALVEMAPCLTEPLLNRAVEMARELPELWYFQHRMRDSVLEALRDCLSRLRHQGGTDRGGTQGEELTAPASARPEAERSRRLSAAQLKRILSQPTIRDTAEIGPAIVRLASFLPEPEREAAFDRALIIIRSIDGAAERATAFADLLPIVSDDRKGEVLRRGLEAARQSGSSDALIKIAPYVAAPQQRDVLAASLAAFRAEQSIAYLSGRYRDLVPLLPIDLVSEALTSPGGPPKEHGVRPRRTEREIKGLLLARAAELGDADAALQSALEQDYFDQASILAYLAPHLPEALLNQALEVAAAMEDFLQDEALARLVPRLAELGRPEEALARARELGGDWRAWTLASMVPFLPASARGSAIHEALHAVPRAFLDPERQAAALRRLAPHLPPDLIGDALRAARQIPAEFAGERLEAVVALLPRVPQATKGDAVGEALGDAIRISTDWLWRRDEWMNLAAGIADEMARLPISKAGRLWRDALHSLGNGPRVILLRALSAMTPVIWALGGEKAVREAVKASEDVGRWWP